MLEQLFKDTINEVKFGYLKRKHPFRYCTFGTVSQEKPILRTVVLRDMIEDYTLIFYTDERSPKVKQLKENANAEVLFYHPRKLLQIKTSGIVKISVEDDISKKYVQRVQGETKKDYLTLQKPSSSIKNSSIIEYGEKMNFSVLQLKIIKIEVLQLKKPNHVRCEFLREENWKGQFLVP